jgi:hypothetical protein
MYVSDKILKFYDELEIKEHLPEGIEVMNPFKNQETWKVCREFYSKYYHDQKRRRIILGINPGRFGAGVTGIPFTDPIRLKESCGIDNDFDKKPELSSVFIYSLIDHMGGPEHFYKHYYIGAVSPLGFVKDNKNFNYYDHKSLERSLKPFIVKTLIQQIALGIETQKCFCLGQGKNFEYLQMLNMELKIFREIVPLPHPRWIMQYRRPKLETFLDDIRRQLSV